MARWIAFDQQTSSLLRTRLAQGTTIETLGRGALDYALAKPGTVLTLLPSVGGADAALAVFRPPRRREPVAHQPANVPHRAQQQVANTSTRAGGFLGLSDEPVFEQEPLQEKKGWWRRFWDE